MSVLLNRRRARRDLTLFLDGLTLYVTAGFELGYAWSEVGALVEGEIEPSLVSWLRISEPSALPAQLIKLEAGYPDPAHRLWFGLLRELYDQGAGLTEPLSAFSAVLREEERRDLEAFGRALPTRINLLLMVFFLPPTFLLLFLPLLFALSGE
jgi:hypothetical protein